MNDKNEITPDAAFKLIAGNELFADLCRILLSGERTQKSEEPVAEGEVVIGELTPFEIALFCARNETIDRAKKLADELGECQGPNCPLCRYAKKIKAIDRLFWTSVKLSLNIDDMSLGIKDGYKVVKTSEEESVFSIGIVRLG